MAKSSSLGRILLLAGGLGVLGAGAAAAESNATIQLNNGISLSNNVINIERGKDVTARDLGMGWLDGINHYKAVTYNNLISDFETYLKNNSGEGKMYTVAREKAMMNQFNDLKIMLKNYYQVSPQALKAMTKALEDGTISTSEWKNIPDGLYPIVDYNGKSSISGFYNVESANEASSELSGNYQSQQNTTKKNLAKKMKMINQTEKSSPQKQIPQFEKGKRLTKREKKEYFIRPVLSAGYSGYEKTAYSGAGLRFGRDNNFVNLSILRNLGEGFLTESYTITGPTSPVGLYGVGITTDSGFRLKGVDMNLYLGKKIKGVIGLGIESITYNENQTAQIKNGTQILASNSTTQKMHDSLLRTSAGIDFPVGNSNLEFDITLDYSMNQNKTYPGIEGKVTF